MHLFQSIITSVGILSPGIVNIIPPDFDESGGIIRACLEKMQREQDKLLLICIQALKWNRISSILADEEGAVMEEAGNQESEPLRSRVKRDWFVDQSERDKV